MANGGGLTVRVISNRLGKMQTTLRSKAGDMSKDTADAIVEDARQRVHVVTGALRDSIQAREEGIGYVVEATMPYAAREEYGFHGPDALGRVYAFPGHPYLTPAAEAQRAPFLGRLKRALGDL